MAKKVKNMLRNNMVLCVIVLVAIGLTSIVFAADVKVKKGIIIGDELIIDTNSLVVDPNGNVGIGTNPWHKLDVYGNIRIGTDDPFLIFSEYDSDVNEKNWDFTSMYGDFIGRIVKDDYSAATNWLHVIRNGMAVDAITFPNGNVGVGPIIPSALLDIDSDIVRLRSSKTPSSASDTGNAGDICWDSDYIYVCVATDTWKRTALSTW